MNKCNLQLKRLFWNSNYFLFESICFNDIYFSNRVAPGHIDRNNIGMKLVAGMLICMDSLTIHVMTFRTKLFFFFLLPYLRRIDLWFAKVTANLCVCVIEQCVVHNKHLQNTNCFFFSFCFIKGKIWFECIESKSERYVSKNSHSFQKQ